MKTTIYKMCAVLSLLLLVASLGLPVVQAQLAEQPVPPRNARMVYVSPTGDDANSGRSARKAVKTVERGLSNLRSGKADWLLLERGHEYMMTQSVDQPVGAGADEPVVIAAYGNGDAPTINVGPNADKLSFAKLAENHVVVYDVTLTGLDDPFPILQPGPGWDGPTPQPDPVGAAGNAGYDAKAIARWDVVPYQTFDDKFHIGVVAFHMNGIDRVSFSVDNGPWVDVHEMQLNPRTDVWEYTATLDASLFEEDGPIEVRVIAWPHGAGEPRVLAGALTGTTESARGEHAMFLNTNANGILSSAVRYVSPTGDDANDGLTEVTPKRTISDAIWSLHQTGGAANGGTVYLTAGTHTTDNLGWPKQQATNSNRWLTIAAAPGLGRDDVLVTKGTGDIRPGWVNLLAWRDVTLQVDPSQAPYASWRANSQIWYDNVTINGVDRNSYTWNTWTGGSAHPAGRYMTDSSVLQTHGGPEGFRLVRGVHVEQLLSDAFSSTKFIINSTAKDLNPGASSAHPDIWQFFGGSPSNLIAYGLTTESMPPMPNGVQGFFIQANISDVAIIDSVFDNRPSWSQAFAVNGSASHLLVRDSSFHGGSNWVGDTTTHNVVFESSSFASGNAATPRAGVTFR